MLFCLILHPALSSFALPHTILPGPQLPSQCLSTHQSSCSSRGWSGRGRSSHETPTVHKDSIYVAMKCKCIVTDMSKIEAK